MNNAPFSIGQKVVCLVNAFTLNKGDVVTVLDIYKGCCQWHIDIGLVSPVTLSFRCKKCGSPFSLSQGKPIWAEAQVFAPIDPQYADATSEILEKFTVTEGGGVDKIILPEKATA